MKAALTVASQPPRTPRVMQVASLFDVPLDQKLSMSWNVSLPVEDRDWNLGLIVGPSGAGKSTVGRHLWPGQFSNHTWSERGALIDDFADGLPIKTIQLALTGAGLGTISAWLRPFGTLSGGEQFRASMARVIAETPPGQVAVIDEFTSTVDRTVAKAASHALQKAARRGGLKIVALSCHSDIVDWLQPDWMCELPLGTWQWRSVQRHPPLDFQIRQVPRRIWPRYAPFHYLSSHLPTSATCFGTFLDDECVCFSGCTQRVHPSPKARRIWQVSRQVTLPDYQGLGIATYTEDWLAAWYCAQGYRFRSLTSHPGAIAYYEKSPEWRLVHRGDAHQLKSGGRSNSGFRAHQAQLRMLGVQCWEFVPARAASQPELSRLSLRGVPVPVGVPGRPLVSRCP